MSRFFLPRVFFDTVGVKVWIIIMISLDGTQTLAADSSQDLRDARANQVQAAQTFYKDLRKLGPQVTAEQIVELKKKTVNPAQAQFANALTQTNDQTLVELRRSAIDVVKEKVKRAILPDFILEKFFKKGSSGPPGTLLGPVKLRPVDTSPSKREEIVLDGSNIPKEITFPGKRKK